MKAEILVGVSGSGKSTYVKEHLSHYLNIERDKIREVVLNQKNPEIDISKENLWKHWNFKLEGLVDDIRDNMINNAFEMQNDVVFSDTNLSKSKRDALAKSLEDMGYEVTVTVIGRELTLDQLWKRDAHRKNTVGHDVIAKQYEQFRKEFPLHETIMDFSKPIAVIFDVDGTLAHMAGIRGAFEWNKVGEDNPDFTVISSLIAQHLLGRKILIMSGRDSVCRKDTLDWLNCWIGEVAEKMQVHVTYPVLITDENLFMRPKGSMESDVKVKRDLFMEHVNGKYLVACVFDDRPKVCRGWYDLGLKVIHCGNPYIEF